MNHWQELPHYIRRLRDPRCVVCSHTTTKVELESNELVFSRIGGDSKNGYEVFHRNCLEALD